MPLEPTSSHVGKDGDRSARLTVLPGGDAGPSFARALARRRAAPLPVLDGPAAPAALPAEMPAEAPSAAARIAQLEEALAARDQFIGTLAHTLRNPLSPLYMQICALASQAVDGAPGARALAPRLVELKARTERYLKTLDRLRDFCLASTGDLSLTREEVDLAEVVATVAAAQERELRAAGVELRLSVSPTRGHWDRARLENIVFQLLSNATRFGAGRPVDVAVQGDEVNAFLRVRDRGVGIDARELEAIFQGFERRGRTSPAGLGVSLWMVRKLIQALGGDITVDSERGRGATFAVRLPRRDI